ncbi:hypothetical protein [Macrococcoides caseolyticum]|uniref:hypothetical protein n=1 Tax=Macrococcoides caseolyticum TaxID=69966 RepID=UPI000C31CD5F|nr:hypothetical protein [Macrococcus caseolyticus]PKE07085.1 hypothetical protein CW692_04765 [Macrococcus caseolyticus]PKE24152.1 hypothetical protein CW689_05400 [Macrococcus caseolyticus]
MNQSKNEHRPPEMVDVIKVIKIKYLKGDGTDQNPIRIAEGYYDIEGQFLFELDSLDVKFKASSIANS